MTFNSNDSPNDAIKDGNSIVEQSDSKEQFWPIKMRPKESCEFDVVAIGHAVVDIMVNVSKENLLDFELNKGTMQLTDSKHLGEQILEKLQTSEDSFEIVKSSGGSAGNTIYALAKLGITTGFLGTVFDDELGRHYIQDFQDSSVKCFFSPKKLENMDIGSIDESIATGRCNVFITPDKDRTMLTYLGASANFDIEDVNSLNFSSTGLVYLEGYLFDSVSGTAALMEAISRARQNSTLVSLSLSDPFVVERYKDVILDLITNNKIDILFGNFTEASILSSSDSINGIAEFLKVNSQFAVVTDGSNGSYCIDESELIFVPAFKSNKVADTTGAGDSFAAGTIAGFIRGYSIQDSLKIGSLLAKEVIEHVGPRPTDDVHGILKQFQYEF